MASKRATRAFRIAQDNDGNLSKAMREAGFSKSYSHNPQNLKRTKAWKDLLDSYLPDEILLKRHKEIVTEGSDKDANTALQTAYKLRGRLKEHEGGDTYNQFNFFNQEQLKRIAARIQDGDSTSARAPD